MVGRICPPALLASTGPAYTVDRGGYEKRGVPPGFLAITLAVLLIFFIA